MTRPVPELLGEGAVVRVHGEARAVERRGGTGERPIVRLAGVASRAGAEELRGAELLVARKDLPPLAPGEFWAADLAGCRVVDGERVVGVVRRMVALPSCEALEVGDLLVPLVRDAIRSIDLRARVIDVDLAFLGEMIDER